MTGCENCVFLIYTVKELLEVRVPFDRTYWESLLVKVNSFHMKYILPQLIGEPPQQNPSPGSSSTPQQPTPPTAASAPSPQPTGASACHHATTQQVSPVTKKSGKRRRGRPSKVQVKVGVTLFNLHHGNIIDFKILLVRNRIQYKYLFVMH